MDGRRNSKCARWARPPPLRVKLLLLLLVVVVVVTAFPRLASYIHTLQVSRTHRH